MKEECIKQLNKNQLLETLIVDKIGEGAHRTVFHHAINNNWVVKVENELPAWNFWSGLFSSWHQNIKEFLVWKLVSDEHYQGDWLTEYQYQQFQEFKKWLAPCEWISKDGSILIQQKTEPLTNTSLPEKVPHLLEDVHEGQFGLLHGNIVCHDYGDSFNQNFFHHSRLAKLMKKQTAVEWEDKDDVS